MTDVVVVGAGTAGCVVAARLAERADHAVTLVEAGPDTAVRPTDSHLDAMAEPGRMWPAAYPQGRGVGGTSAINGMLADIPTAADLAPLGLSVADLDTLLPAEPAADGELGPLDRALLATAPDAVRVPLTRRDGSRCSVAEVYLDPARARANLDVRSGSLVTRVALDGQRAVGVELADGDVVAADAVVLAAGAIHTPALLRRSGLDDPLIGDRLLDHPSLALTVTLRPEAVPDPHALVTATAMRRGGIEVLPMNHLGPAEPGLAAVLVALLRPQSEGRLAIPADPGAEPTVGREWSPADQARLAAAEHDVRELLARPPFAAVLAAVDPLAGPGAHAHACGTCRAVLDDRGAVRGTTGLYVCDASALPHLSAGGLMLVTVAWAERFARRFT